MSEKDELIQWIIFWVVYVIIWFIGYKVAHYSLWGLLFVIVCIIVFHYWMGKNTSNKKISPIEENPTNPSKEKNESKKIELDTSNNKYLKQALKDSPHIKDILESTEQEIEQEKKMIEGLKNDYKAWKYQEVIDFNEMYMWPIHTKNIVEFLWVIAISILKSGNKKGFEWYVGAMVSVIILEDYKVSKTGKWNILDSKLKIAKDILQQYDIDYNFWKKSFLSRLTEEQQDKALKWVTQVFLLT